MFDLLFFSPFFGLILGTLTGLIPGFHVNNVAHFFSFFVFSDSAFFLCCVVVALSVIHSFVDFIPSCFFSVPSSDSYISVLPAHKFFQVGLGDFAVSLTIFGGFFGGVFSLILCFSFINFLSFFYSFIYFFIPFILFLFIFLLFISSKNKLSSLFVIIFSSLVGFFAFRIFVVPNPIMPLIIGFFALPSVLFNLLFGLSFFPQRIININFSFSDLFAAFVGSIAGSFVSIFPGLGNSIAGFFASKCFSNFSPRSFLVLLGSINTSNYIFCFIVLFVLDKARSGASLFVQNSISIDFTFFVYFLIIIFVCICFGAIVTFFISKFVVYNLSKISFTKLNFFIVIFLFCFTFFCSGVFGLFFLFVSFFIGFFALLSNVPRSNCMCFIMFPVALYYFIPFFM